MMKISSRQWTGFPDARSLELLVLLQVRLLKSVSLILLEKLLLQGKRVHVGPSQLGMAKDVLEKFVTDNGGKVLWITRPDFYGVRFILSPLEATTPLLVRDHLLSRGKKTKKSRYRL